MKNAILFCLIFPQPAFARYWGDNDGGLMVIVFIAITLTIGAIHSKLKRLFKNRNDVETQYLFWSNEIKKDKIDIEYFFWFRNILV